MNLSPPKQYFAAAHRAVVDSDSIEWEELPSLAGSLAQRLVARGALARSATGSLARLANQALAAGSMEAPPALAPGSAWSYVAPWHETQSAPLDEVEPSPPFREMVYGLATREVHEPDVFSHFFGATQHRF